MKKLLLTLVMLMVCGRAWAVTAFNVSVAPSGGDYTTLNGIFSAAGTIDLTSAATKVFSITGGITGTMSDNTAVTGVTSGATGTCVHTSSVNSQILIKSISGTFQSGEIVYETLGTNYVMLGNAGDSPSLYIDATGSWSAADTTQVAISTIATGPSNGITLTATGSARHKGVYSTTSGYYLLSVNGSAIKADTSYITINGLQINVTGSGDGIQMDGDSQDGIVISNNIIYKNAASNTYNGIYDNIGFVRPYNALIYNNIIYGNWQYCVDSQGDAKYYNNTIYGCSTYGIYHPSYQITMVNNAIMGNSTNDYNEGDGGSDVTQSYNMVSDTSLSGTGDLESKTASNQFNNLTGGSQNFNLKSGADAISAGTSESGILTTDITGAMRSTWDIGAFLYASLPSSTFVQLNKAQLNHAQIN